MLNFPIQSHFQLLNPTAKIHFLLSKEFYQMVMVFGCDMFHLYMHELLIGVFPKFLFFTLQKLLLISNKN